MSTHTPGPWQTHKDCTDIYTSSGFSICEFYSLPQNGEELANARLIASAPDLLEALKAMLEKAYKQNWNDGYPAQVSAAETAIARATGKECA